jgi:methionine salvage enolase-phosphatase E1
VPHRLAINLMTEPLAVLTDLEGTAIPMSFMTETLLPLARQRLGGYIARLPTTPTSRTPYTKRAGCLAASH